MSGNQLIDLSSAYGQLLFDEVASGTFGCCYQPKLHRIFTKQKGNTTCGMVSCCHILSAHHISSADSPPKFTEDNMFDFVETSAAIKQEKLCKDGMTLDQVHQLLVAHGCRNVEQKTASDCTVEVFRTDAIRALSRSDSAMAIIVNYDMDSLGQNLPFGHHSPLAAYHAATDRLLILDTWHSTSECWAKVEALHSAMNTFDDEAGKSRGYCVVEL